MIHKNSMLRPVYREVIRTALMTAWRKRHLWPLALFAGILHTGGVYDSLLYFTDTLSARTYDVVNSFSLVPIVAQLPVFHFSSMAAFTDSFISYQRFIFSGLMLLVLVLASFIAQGALTAGVAQAHSLKPFSWRALLGEGARRVWPIGGLNLITLGLLWMVRFFALLPMVWYISAPSLVSFLVYFLTFCLFLGLTVCIITLHFLGLNAIVRLDVPLLEALRRSWQAWRAHWMVVLEAALLLFAVGFGMLLAGSLVFLVMVFPVLILLLLSALLQWKALFLFLYGLTWFLMGLLLFFVGMMTIVFNYAVWNRLYHRLEEGGVLPRVHRWVHQLLNFIHHPKW